VRNGYKDFAAICVSLVIIFAVAAIALWLTMA